MYEAFYDLRELPFELTPDPRFLHLTPRHLEALSNLEYGLASAKAVTVLTGEAGTGKTTLLRAALESQRCHDVRAFHLTNPALSRQEFVEMLARGFGLSAAASRSKVALLSELETLLKERRAQGEVTALIVDEAQSLSDDLLEEIRLLANIESATEKLLPLVLVGQPEFSNRLEQPNLRQLKQRVSLRCEIVPFTLLETAAYIVKRISLAGGLAERLFTREAVMLIHERSRGIPRTINVICDNALVTGMALGRQPVDRRIVEEVVRDFHLGSRRSPPTRARPVRDDGIPSSRDHPSGAAASAQAEDTRAAATRPARAGASRLFTILGGGRS
ncbi:MAG TPA: AAA family ATPase [Vicinamibacterales bacterium]|nr:AAA family ATPase [Vicinamibacterales bacterium]